MTQETHVKIILDMRDWTELRLLLNKQPSYSLPHEYTRHPFFDRVLQVGAEYGFKEGIKYTKARKEEDDYTR
jgi:hypothetical protein